VRAKLVRIGNFRGIRIPKPILERCGFGNEVELHAEAGRLVVLPAGSSRAGWEEAFATAAANASGAPLLSNDVRSRFDEEEWTW
jgi:antitoxin MazE